MREKIDSVHGHVYAAKALNLKLSKESGFNINNDKDSLNLRSISQIPVRRSSVDQFGVQRLGFGDHGDEVFLFQLSMQLREIEQRAEKEREATHVERVFPC